MIAVAGSPARPRVPAEQRMAAGHLTDFSDQSRTAATFWTEALSCPRAHTDATTRRTLGPVRPARPLSLRSVAAAAARNQTTWIRVADSALRVNAAFARRRLALSHL